MNLKVIKVGYMGGGWGRIGKGGNIEIFWIQKILKIVSVFSNKENIELLMLMVSCTQEI